MGGTAACLCEVDLMESAATVCLTMTVFPLLGVEWGCDNRCMWHVGMPVGATGCILNTRVLIPFLTKMDFTVER